MTDAAREHAERVSELQLLAQSGQLSEAHETYLIDRINKCWKQMTANERAIENMRDGAP